MSKRYFLPFRAWAPFVAVGGGAAILGLTTGSANRKVVEANSKDHFCSAFDYNKPLPKRQELLEALAGGSRDSPFDILVIGGGATGTGIAVDAASRGLKTALVEREDFGSGTSSRSTKLIHGGVRYLEKAVFGLDVGQLKLVYEALGERTNLLDNAPHLTNALPIMTPCWSWWEVLYYWAGMKAYDLVARGETLEPSKFSSARDALRTFPTLATRTPEGKSLKGVIVYHDGQFNDSRLNVTLACTAAAGGAAVANHAEVEGLLKDSAGRVVGATVRDLESGRRMDVHAKVVVNAAGPFVDGVRAMSDPAAPEMITPSSGVHVVLPDYYSGKTHGIIIPRTRDGRVLFVLPWLQHTVAGTTDAETTLTMRPRPTQEEVDFILDEVKDLLNIEVRQADVLSAWSGIRPLAADPDADEDDTASISRDHVVSVGSDGLVTITGGKWTTYRKMAEEVVDTAVGTGRLPQAGPSGTEHLKLLGAPGWDRAMHARIAQNYTVPHRPGAIDTQVAEHLSHAYGDRALMITRIAEDRKLGRRLVRGHPVIEAEVVYAVQSEYATTAIDFLANRCRLAFLDTAACRQAIPRVVELMGEELKWSRSRRAAEAKAVEELLQTFSPS